ncbi:MAG: hypothetical protein P1U81_04780 [Verrucomicrobiales bacterium]|jgi:hypothetical protein|nr:hypothetical protein [Verrucomicrobiales bacterium]
MKFIEDASFPVGEVYLGFFVISFLILALILLSGLPGGMRKLVHAVRLIGARRRRNVRMLADRDQLEEAGETLVGMTLFEEEAGESAGDQDVGETSRFVSDAA